MKVTILLLFVMVVAIFADEGDQIKSRKQKFDQAIKNTSEWSNNKSNEQTSFKHRKGHNSNNKSNDNSNDNSDNGTEENTDDSTDDKSENIDKNTNKDTSDDTSKSHETTTEKPRTRTSKKAPKPTDEMITNLISTSPTATMGSLPTLQSDVTNSITPTTLSPEITEAATTQKKFKPIPEYESFDSEEDFDVNRIISALQHIFGKLKNYYKWAVIPIQI